jgi:hypothetical protein
VPRCWDARDLHQLLYLLPESPEHVAENVACDLAGCGMSGPFATCKQPVFGTAIAIPDVYYFVKDTIGIYVQELKGRKMLKITREENGEVVIKLSGRMDAEDLTELETLVTSEAASRPIVLDLKDLTLVDQDAVSFLKRCEADNITLKNCPAYIREWITRKRKQS